MNMDMNTRKQNKITLYVKEQLVIGTMVLCFVLSGICLPFIKERISPGPPSSTSESSEGSNGTGENKDKNFQDKPEESPSKKEDGMETNSSESPQTTTVQDESTDSNTSTPSDSTDTRSDDSSNTTPSRTPGNAANPSAPPSTDGGSGSSTETPGKEWVPPVYETIHHEAVYETKTFYYCSGAIDESGVVCNQKFDSLQGWATHKSIHGG